MIPSAASFACKCFALSFVVFILILSDYFSYRHALELPHLPDMVFHKNTLTLEHDNGAVLTFTPIEALKKVRNEKLDIKVSCSEEWQESRPRDKTGEKLKPFDWTFSTDYQGTTNDKFVVEPTDMKIDKFKLMVKEQILFYNDLTLFEDELHDNGTSVSSVKVVSKNNYMSTCRTTNICFRISARDAVRFLCSPKILHARRQCYDPNERNSLSL